MGFDINWDSFSHQQLYDMIHNRASNLADILGEAFADGGINAGKGASAGSDAQQTWVEFNQLMAESRNDLETALRAAGASWDGQAADAMRMAMTPMAQWTEDAGTSGQTCATAVENHLDAFDYAVHTMPEPVPVNTTTPTGFAGIIAMQQDQAAQEAAAQQAKQRAVEVMRRYTELSASAVNGMAHWAPPADVTVNVAPAAPTTQPPVQSHPAGHVTEPRGLTVPARSTVPGRTIRQQSTTSPPPASVATSTSDYQPPATASPTTGISASNSPTPNGDPVTVVVGEPGPNGGGAGPVGGEPRIGTPGRNGAQGRTVEGVPERGVTARPGRGAPEAPGKGGAAAGEGENPEAAVAGREAAEASGGRSTTGAVPASGRGRKEEDKEHRIPAYLRGPHEEFWDPRRPVAPPVIGE